MHREAFAHRLHLDTDGWARHPALLTRQATFVAARRQQVDFQHLRISIHDPRFRDAELRIADECLGKIAVIYPPYEPAARPLTEMVRLAARGCPTPSSVADVKLRGLTYISTYPSLDDERLARHAVVHMGLSFADSPAMNDAEASAVSKRMFQAFDA